MVDTSIVQKNQSFRGERPMLMVLPPLLVLVGSTSGEPAACSWVADPRLFFVGRLLAVNVWRGLLIIICIIGGVSLLR